MSSIQSIKITTAIPLGAMANVSLDDQDDIQSNSNIVRWFENKDPLWTAQYREYVSAGFSKLCDHFGGELTPRDIKSTIWANRDFINMQSGTACIGALFFGSYQETMNEMGVTRNGDMHKLGMNFGQCYDVADVTKALWIELARP